MSAVRRGPRPATDRLRRLLVMLPWLMERGSAPVAEMSERFQVGEAELVRDLEMVAMCGLPPFIDEMIDVFIDEGMVYAGVPRVFTKPLRLTAPEGFSLLVAGRAAMELPGADPDGALGQALAKLADVLGDDGVVLEQQPPPAAAAMATAAADSERLRIRYWSPAREEVTEREITPRTVFVDRGRWYVLADDQRSGEERIFRVDRIEEWAATGVHDAPRIAHAPTGDEWFADSDLPTAVLELGPAAVWVAERYPLIAREPAGVGLRITVTVTSEEWLRELLLRLGTNAVVVSPPEWRDLGARAARDLLARYEPIGS